MFDLSLQYYPAKIKTTKPLWSVTLEYFLQAIKNPSEKVKSTFNNIAKAEAAGDMKLKAELKQNGLYYFTPCVTLGAKGIEKIKNGRKYTSYRCYENIESFNGIAVLDFDHIDKAEEFKRFIFDKFDFIIAGFLSPSKRGVKFLVKIPIVNSIESFKAYYFGLGYVMDKYKGWDGTGQNCVLPLFISWDPNTLIRKNASTFNIKAKKADFGSAKITNIKDIVVQDGDQQKIFNNATKALNSIIDNGHPQLRSVCISLGGYVAGGYMSFSEAEGFIHSIIPNHNYLRKGISGYKKTATEAINKGMQKPINLND